MPVYLNTLLDKISSVSPLGGQAIGRKTFLVCQSSAEAQTLSDTSESLGAIDRSAILENSSTFVGILASIFGGVSIILGIHYLRSLKEKHITETFSFWSQIHMRIIRLYGLLSVEIGLLNNMYPPEERKNWETINPTAEKLATFKNSVEETLAYLQSTTDQLPAYIGWSEDFSKFMQFLANVTQYDIEASDEKFVESTDGIIKDRKMYWEDVCKTMQRLQEGIENRQKMVEKKICRESIFQKLCKGIGVNRKTI